METTIKSPEIAKKQKVSFNLISISALSKDNCSICGCDLFDEDEITEDVKDYNWK